MGLPLSIILHLRGETSNGLCLLHDKTFELGLFTLTLDLRVAPNADRIGHSPWGQENIAPFEGRPIRLGAIKPAGDSLRKHWERIAFVPGARIRLKWGKPSGLTGEPLRSK